jgi:hypothetical protein
LPSCPCRGRTTGQGDTNDDPRREYRIISSDSHTVEPPDLWEKWLERKYLDTAPKLVDDGDGGHAWIYMGATTPEPLGLVTCVGTRPRSSSGPASATA